MTVNDTEVLDDSAAKVTEAEHDSDTDCLDEADLPAEEAQNRGVDEKPNTRRSSIQRSVSLSVKSLVIGAAIVTLVVLVGVLGWLYIDARQQLSTEATQSADIARAEKIALDYAVNAATMDYQDLSAWHVRLVAGTSPELNQKLSEAGTSMEQVLVPLQWSSSAQPLVGKVRSSTDGIYVVDSFVSVQTKTVQAPEALQSTATYSVTIDSNNNWQIIDVGGIGSVVGPN